jgi:hypothetical protein
MQPIYRLVTWLLAIAFCGVFHYTLFWMLTEYVLIRRS